LEEGRNFAFFDLFDLDHSKNVLIKYGQAFGKLPDNLKDDPSATFLLEAAKENTVTVVHLIYKSKNYETSSKDYDFSHVAMKEHWEAGVRDVHLSMRHKEWLERPQSGETMVSYDLSDEGIPLKKE